jgi:hypothetical protein
MSPLIGAGCAGDLPEARKVDSYFPPTPDVSPSPWPDTMPSTGGDTFWGNADGYSGSPFGCKQDSDCFGQVCCATPWGVKLCAPTCSK